MTGGSGVERAASLKAFQEPPERGGGAVAQSVERATPGQEVPGLIPALAARSLLVWVGVSIM